VLSPCKSSLANTDHWLELSPCKSSVASAAHWLVVSACKSCACTAAHWRWARTRTSAAVENPAHCAVFKRSETASHWPRRKRPKIVGGHRIPLRTRKRHHIVAGDRRPLACVEPLQIVPWQTPPTAPSRSAQPDRRWRSNAALRWAQRPKRTRCSSHSTAASQALHTPAPTAPTPARQRPRIIGRHRRPLRGWRAPPHRRWPSPPTARS
jgi:hypothetical protein